MTTKTIPANDIKNTYWMMGLGLLAVRVIQGFIYWGGGSRRFIYAPDKLNPEAPHWMAYKFQTAMPGALLGLEHVISFMLQHFWLLYAGVILFSAAELFAGLFLMLGLFTRISAILSMLFSVLLMLMFGWQGRPVLMNGRWRPVTWQWERRSFCVAQMSMRWITFF